MAKDTKNMEETFEELNKILDKLENGDVSLEESFEYYTAGIKLVKNCNDKIDKVEKKIMVLDESGDSHEF